MLRGFLSAVILIISIVIIELDASGKLGLQHAPVEAFLEGSFYFLLLFSLLILSVKFAIENGNNNVSLYFFSGVALILLISAICLAIYLSIKYVEFTALFTLFFAVVVIDLLIGEEKSAVNQAN